MRIVCIYACIYAYRIHVALNIFVFWIYLTDCSSSLPKAVNVGVIDFSNNTADLQLYKAIHWPNNRGAPADSPPCGFDEEKCKTVDPTERNNSIYDAYKGLFNHLLL